VGRYASNTQVSEDRSRAELERTLLRYGADKFGYFFQEGMAIILFEFDGWPIRMNIPMPRRDEEEFMLTDTGRERVEGAALKAWEQAKRQRWRALVLMIKAKFEAILMGSASFEREFMGWIALPGGKTVGDEIIGKLLDAKEGGQMPKALPEFKIG